MKTKVKVTTGESEWKVASLKDGADLETIPISEGNKWGPLLKRAIANQWQVVQCENAAGTAYEWFEEEKLWVPMKEVFPSLGSLASVLLT